MTQLLVTRHAPGWADALPGVRHYLYPVHRSGAYLTSQTLAARLSLLLCRWLARATSSRPSSLCVHRGVDTKLSAEEAQLWALLADFEDDVEPGAHACRLRLWLATRCCVRARVPVGAVGRAAALPVEAAARRADGVPALRLRGAHAPAPPRRRQRAALARIAFLDAALEADAAAALVAAAAHGAATNRVGRRAARGGAAGAAAEGAVPGAARVQGLRRGARVPRRSSTRRRWRRGRRPIGVALVHAARREVGASTPSSWRPTGGRTRAEDRLRRQGLLADLRAAQRLARLQAARRRLAARARRAAPPADDQPRPRARCRSSG